MDVAEERVNFALLSFYDIPEQRQLLSCYQGPGVDPSVSSMRAQAMRYQVCEAADIDITEWTILQSQTPSISKSLDSLQDRMAEWRAEQKERALASVEELD